MEKYGNSGCHQKSATESTSGVQSNSGSCIIISCIMTTGIDNILKAIIKFSSFYQWWCLSRNMKRTKQITLRRLNSDLRNVGVVTRGPIGCLFNILRWCRTTQGPHKDHTRTTQTNKIYLSLVPPGCLRLDRSRETESETQVLSSKYDAVYNLHFMISQLPHIT